MRKRVHNILDLSLEVPTESTCDEPSQEYDGLEEDVIARTPLVVKVNLYGGYTVQSGLRGKHGWVLKLF